jgi:hypothetical protein
MFSLTTTQFIKYNVTQMHQFILHQNTDHFEIIIPRRRFLPTHKKYQVFWEFHLAAYAGHLIAGVGEYFAYNVPSPHAQRPFRFEIHTRNHQSFIDALSGIITGIYFKQDINDFERSANKFFLDAFNINTDPVTIGLIIQANQILGNETPS